MLIPKPQSLKLALNSRESQGFVSLTEAASDESTMKLRTQLLNDIKLGLQYAFQTRNETTLCLGSCDSEADAVLCNLIESGDVVLVGITGETGQRAAEIAAQYGGKVHVVRARPGTALSLAEIRDNIERCRPNVLFIVQGDSSTGVLQPVAEVGDLCRSNNCVLVIDAVFTIAAAPLLTDTWKIDVVYTTCHQTFGGPVSLVPITFGPRALAKIARRKTPMRSSYWNAKILADNWGRTGTEPNISLNAMIEMRTALATMCNEGIGKRIDRYYVNAKRLQEGLQHAIGLELFVEQPKNRLPTVVIAKLPNRVNGKSFAKCMADRYDVCVSAHTSYTIGHIVRIIITNEYATQPKIDLILKAFHNTLSMMIPNYVDPALRPYY